MTFYRGVSIRIEKYQAGKYHHLGPMRQILNFFLRPILNRAPQKFRPMVRRSHVSAGEVIEKATTHEALEVLYKKGVTKSKEKFFSKMMRRIWFGMDNALGIYNRLVLVKKKFAFFAAQPHAVRILSIASGSARAIIDSLDWLKLKKKEVEISFLDKNPRALDHGRFLVSQEKNSNIHFRFLNDTASNFVNYFESDQKLDIIEMVGLLDYFEDAKIKELLSLIHNRLSNDGVLITANIADNRERPFVTNLIGWKMIYRKPEEMINMAIAAGFRERKMEIIFEPTMIHFILIAQK